MRKTSTIEIGGRSHVIRQLPPIEALVAMPLALGVFGPVLRTMFATDDALRTALQSMLEGGADDVVGARMLAAIIDEVPNLDPAMLRDAPPALLAGCELAEIDGARVTIDAQDRKAATTQINRCAGDMFTLIRLMFEAFRINHFPT